MKTKMWLVSLALTLAVELAFVVNATAQDFPDGYRGTWTEAREDTPGVIFIHRHGSTTEVSRVPGTGEGGIPLELKGPSEVSVKWTESYPPGSEPWPAEITVLDVTYLNDGIQRVHVDGDALPAAAELMTMSNIVYAYEVEFTNPLFSRVLTTDRLIVRLAPGITIEQITTNYAVNVVAPMLGSDVEYVVQLLNAKADVPADMVAAIDASGLVEWVQIDAVRDAEFFYTPTDTAYGNQWHLNAISQTIGAYTAPNNIDVNAPAAWNITRGSPSIKIAVVDDAIETNHVDLVANISSTGGYDFFSNDTDPSPDTPNDLHGTPCAGVAAAVEGNTNGGVGIAHQCPIVPIKICSNGQLPYDSVIGNSVRHAAQYADIVTCSWGYVNPAPVTLSSVRYALQSGAGGRGSVVFFAAGNDAGFVPHAITFNGTGTYNVRWRYAKDASISSGLDRCFVDSMWYPSGATEFFDGVVPPALPGGMVSAGGTWTSLTESLGNRAESGTQFIGSPTIAHGASTTVSFNTTSTATNSQLWYYMHVDAQPTTYVLNTATVYDYGQVEYKRAASPTWITGNVMGGQPVGTSYPAADPETIAVGASDDLGLRSHYSQWGTALDFVAPSDGTWYGLGIETTDLMGTNGYDNGNYCQAATASKFGGTSSATPLAAGIGALVRSVNPNLSPAQVRNILRSSCIKLNQTWYTYSGAYHGGRSPEVGYGQVDAYAAVQLAQTTPDVLVLANDLKITEVSPLDGICPFLEIYNQSPGQAHILDGLMLTDTETGGDPGESSFQFPPGSIIPPQGTIVVALNQATPAFVAELNNVVGLGAASPGGLQLFECVGSGQLFNGIPIPVLVPHGPLVNLALTASDNVALVATPGMSASYLADVVDGMAYGTPFIDSGCAIGVAPRVIEPGTFASGASTTLSYQRNGWLDTEDSLPDFPAQARSPGRLVYGMPVQSLVADPLTSSEIGISWVPVTPGDMVLVVASPDPVFGFPVNGMGYGPGPFGADMVIHFGPEFPPPTVLIDGPYPPQTPMYYQAWTADPMMNYSAGVTANASTMPAPISLPLHDTFPATTFNSTHWPYPQGTTIDSTVALAPPTPANCAMLDSLPSADVLATASIDASTVTNVQVIYWIQEAGSGDPPEPGEDLIVEYLDPARNWLPLTIHPAGAPGPAFQMHQFVIPPADLHNEFRVRFRSTAVSTAPTDLDLWFIDDVLIEEFPVLSGFTWGTVPSPQSVGVPFSATLTANSSMGGVFSNYAGTASLNVVVSGNPTEPISLVPTNATPFLTGVWSNQPVTILDQPSSTVQLVSTDGGISSTSVTFQVLIDADTDGMDDSWEYSWWQDLGVANGLPGSDQDNDRFSDYGEFVAGTVPTNPASLLQLSLISPVMTGSNVLEWGSVTGRLYSVSRSTNLVAGFSGTVTNNLSATPPTNQWADTSAPTNAASIYYRLQVTEP